MPQLNTTISSGLWQTLLDDVQRTQEPIAHIITKALAEYLQVPHHTLYQVSTATIPVIIEGCKKAPKESFWQKVKARLRSSRKSCAARL